MPVTSRASAWSSLVLLLACSLFSAAPSIEAASSENRQGRAVDALFAGVHRAGAGIAVGVYRGGRVEYAKGFGTANLESLAPISASTPFHVASVSKQFTAFAIALLARDRKLNLDADVREYLPYLPDFGHVITVRHLIHHTSGLRDQMELAITRGETLNSLIRQGDVIAMVRRQRDLNFVPGTEYSYGNTGYTLLAEIVKVVSGRTLRQFTTERMFQPLGMKNTFFADDIGEVVPGRAHSYARGAGVWRRVPLNYETVGATGLTTTLEDLLKWGRNFIHPVVGDTELMKQISTSGRLNDGTAVDYGFGLEFPNVAGRKAVMHMGYDAAFRAATAYFPSEDLAIVILRNDGGDPHYSTAAVADIYRNDGNVGSPDTPPPITPTREALQAYQGHYLSSFGKLLTLQLQNDQLFEKTAGQPPRPLIFRADGTFDPGLDARIWSYYRFGSANPAQSKTLQKVSTDGGGIVTRYERVEPVKPSSEALASLAGDYRSSELDVTYTFAVEDGRLVARSIRLDKTLLFEPSVTDRFDAHGWEMSTVTFERDARGQPIALRANVGNSRNLRFQRVAP